MRFPFHLIVAADASRRSGLNVQSSAVLRPRLHPSQRGVALVITVIMLAVITFMAIAFLVLSGRERGAVSTATDQAVARFTADTAIERAKADLLSGILAFTNQFNYDLRVSTNYINPFGFDASQPKQQLIPAELYWTTNASYVYPNGNPVTGDDFLQNLANLAYDPRPPVFITNRLTGGMDFRYYLDLNRNGRFDTNGYLPVINRWGTFYDANGDITASLSNAVYSFFTGDPEWVGVLERPDQPHSSTNRFTSRFAWIAVPAGKALDLNTVHNQTKMLGALREGFLRNMGVAPFEINLAAFLADLNTNLWDLGTSIGLEPPYLPSVAYQYRTNAPLSSLGSAFDEALSLIRFRYDQQYRDPRRSVQALFGAPGVAAFSTDGIDDYANGPLMSDTAFPVEGNNDALLARNDQIPWPGADGLRYIFTPQDFFNKTTTSIDTPTQVGFTERLLQAGSKTNSYDRYTYYRLLSMLGTDSDPEPPGKMNLNYDNLARRNPFTGVASATNFYPWTALAFFTNAAERLLRTNSLEWRLNNGLEFMQTFGTNQPFGLDSIPVLVSNRLAYTPAVHRLLQLAANIWETKTTNNLPTVFRPLFTRNAGGLFISGYELVDPANPNVYLTAPMEAQYVPAGANMPINVYGVPWVVGAKKGLPNFNEFAIQSVFDITRKLKVSRPSLDAKVSQYWTNQMYIIGLSNAVAIEMWNSYKLDYTNGVVIRLLGDVSMSLTNQYGVATLNQTFTVSNTVALVNLPTNITRWRGVGLGTQPSPQSFVVPFQTNIVFVPPAIWDNGTRNLITNLTTAFNARDRNFFPLPRWGLLSKTRLRCVMQLGGASGPIIDYVQLDGLDDARDLAAEFSRSDGSPGWGSLWETNRLGGSTDERIPTRGMAYQTRISLGDFGADTMDWTDYGPNPAGQQKTLAIAKFRAFMRQAAITPQTADVTTNLSMQVPFSPSRRISRYHTWQANDPLVHYMAGDMRYWPDEDEGVRDESVKPGVPVQALENIGRLNKRYQPWGGNPLGSTDPNKHNLAVKDPGARSSDNWDFPTNQLPNLGWLGRVHRGTPWQTVFLKADNIAANADGRTYWARDWTGNTNAFDALNSSPANDRLIFDLFTTAFSDSSSRGQMSINQAELPTWSAVFGGVLAVTNTASDADLVSIALTNGSPRYRPVAIEPAGVYLPNDTNTWSPLVTLVNGINDTRADTNLFPRRIFTRLGDILAVPELTERSPFLNRSPAQMQSGLTDAVYERLPQQVLGLLKVGEPRFVIYGYGQTLRPAVNSVVTSGPFAGLCENYQITAETVVRAVVRVEGAPDNPRLVVEDYNVLPPD